MITRVVFGLGLTSMESPTLTRIPFLDFMTPKRRASASRVSLSLNEVPHGTVYRSGASPVSSRAVRTGAMWQTPTSSLPICV